MSAALKATLLAGGAALAAAAALFVRERATAAREEKECEEALAEPAPCGTVRACWSGVELLGGRREAPALGKTDTSK